jgi:hypothetical protein
VNVTLITFCGMLDLRAAVLGRMGGLSPSKSVCSILPIARHYLRAGASRSGHLLAPGPCFFREKEAGYRGRSGGAPLQLVAEDVRRIGGLR